MAKKSTKCPQCQYWSRSPRPKEQFQLLWGLYEFDVEKAKELTCDGRQAIEWPVEELAAILNWPERAASPRGAKGTLTFRMGVRIDPQHITHVDPDIPIILGIPTGKLRSCFVSRRPALVIDGHHRVARAVTEGRTTILGYLLNARETRSILSVKVPARR